MTEFKFLGEFPFKRFDAIVYISSWAGDSCGYGKGSVRTQSQGTGQAVVTNHSTVCILEGGASSIQELNSTFETLLQLCKICENKCISGTIKHENLF